MTRYANLNGASPISRFEIGTDFIDVQFGDWVYRYNDAYPGHAHVERMKALAENGRGLATYISTRVKNRYALKRPR
jgi:hypothetical protein